MTERPVAESPLDKKLIAYLDEHPDDIQPRDLNNFRFNLPGGMMRVSVKHLEAFGGVDTRTLREKSVAENNPHIGYYSNKRLEQTYAQFYASIDSALEELNIDPEQIARINGRATSPINEPALKARGIDVSFFKSTRRGRIARVLNRVSIPVYQYLRKQGYGHFDLV
ncbi:MAG TPA: hypothetical protein VI612_00200 [Candidatus Nanoarchaeia archaeon]|nr:hypothetical protein [Candidatus Nanoarchaeia archaeon]